MSEQLSYQEPRAGWFPGLFRDPPPRSPFRRRLLNGPLLRKYRILALLWAVAALFFWTWWLQPEHKLPGVQYFLVTFALAWLYVLQGYFTFVFPRSEAPAGAPPEPGSVRVAMITTKTPSEPFAVVRRTLEAMLDQTYPHDTWLADEDPAPETIAWCEAHGVRLSTRKGREDYQRQVWPRRARCKEGNLAYFYDHYGYDGYDFVSQLDADHVPSPSYLEEIMRGFADPGVGYVSAPSICSNNAAQSWAARTRLYTEAAFHGVLQCGYTAAFTPMCIGSHYAVRTKALREVGGLGPELAEDHSTTLMMSAGGWRGVHAIDAIATGDGPATFSDLCIQEFQWARSLVTILLEHTPRYLARLPLRLKVLFLFCQMLYPMIALNMALFYLFPILALAGDFRYADVTFPAFLLHAAPSAVVLTVIAFALRRDGFFRPADGKVLSWEKILFIPVQWPWVAFGCVMALRDKMAASFVEFRVTPKGGAAVHQLPMPVYLVYLLLGFGAIVPVLLADDLEQANGFYVLSLLNALAYVAIALVAIIHHVRDNNIRLGLQPELLHLQAMGAIVLVMTFGTAMNYRATAGLYSLSLGLEPFRLYRIEYSVSGAGLGQRGAVRVAFDPGWIERDRE